MILVLKLFSLISYGTYYVSGSVLGILYILPHLIHTKTYEIGIITLSSFPEKETEEQRG
jgi:hypothetical protein